MRANTESISLPQEYIMKNNNLNTYPDIIDQVDKVINKYKNQLERLKPKNEFNKEKNIPYYSSTERKQNQYSKIMNNNPEQNINNVCKNIFKNNNFLNTERNCYNNEEIKEEINDYDSYQKSKQGIYNFKYSSKKRDEYNPINIKNNLSNELTNEMENDNIKLGSALTLEKTKVVQLLNLLKIKENEINNLKLQIDNFEEKVNEIENKYQNIIYSIEQQQSLKLKDIYNNISDEKNKLKVGYNEIKRNTEIQLEQASNELNINKKLLKMFFDLFNKNIDLLTKTEILQQKKNNFITENDFSEKNTILAVESLDKLINKLVQDNKDLYNELYRIKGELDNNMNMGNNINYIRQENNSLRELVNNLTKENSYLKSNKSYNNIRNINNRNNYGFSKINKSQTNNERDATPTHHHHIIHSVCRHCTPDCLNKQQNNDEDEISPIEKLKLKINNLENQIRSQTYS